MTVARRRRATIGSPIAARARRERRPEPGGQWSSLESNTGRTGSVPAHCCSDHSGIGRASTTPNSVACFIKHVKLCLLQRHIECNILCHGCSPPGCLCCDQKALSESHQVIRRLLARLPPCFVISILAVRLRSAADVISAKAPARRRSDQYRS